MVGNRMALLESSGLLAPRNIALLILAAAVAAIGGAFAYESFGYLPCELCYKERAPYYAAFALAPFAAFAAQTGRARLARGAFLLMALLFAGNAILSFYHSGVEWKIFAGPSDCSGPLSTAPSVTDFMKQLQSVKVVRCDEPNLWIFGLTLANWNVAISAALAGLALLAVRPSSTHGGAQ
jgi:disulfide bond formation protein DsbB